MERRVNKEKGYVLHLRPYRETSLIVDLITESHGMIAVVAKSARGAKSRFRGQLNALTPLLLSWSGFSDLKTLTSAEVVGLPYRLSGDALWASFYAHELMMRLLLRGELSPHVFVAYERLLNALRNDDHTELRYFELVLLHELGYAPSLSQTAEGHSIEEGAWYRYVPDHGFVSHQGEPDTLTFGGGSLLALNDQALDSLEKRQSAKRLLRYLLSQQLGPKPLKTPKMWLDMQH